MTISPFPHGQGPRPSSECSVANWCCRLPVRMRARENRVGRFDLPEKEVDSADDLGIGQRARYMSLESIAPLSDDPIVGLPVVAA